MIVFAFDYIARCMFLYNIKVGSRWRLEGTHLNDGSSSDRADALRADVEDSFENADIAGDHETDGDSRVDMTAADVTESL